MVGIELQGSSVYEKIKQSLEAAEGLYYQLILLVGETGSGKSGVLKEIAKQHDTSVVNVNLMVSSALLELTNKQRTLVLPKILGDIANSRSPLVILDNLEILFDKNLGQDPLRLLQGLSRNKIIIASWSGSISAKRLLYAQNDHLEYRSYDSVEALIVGMNSKTDAYS